MQNHNQISNVEQGKINLVCTKRQGINDTHEIVNVFTSKFEVRHLTFAFKSFFRKFFYPPSSPLIRGIKRGIHFWLRLHRTKILKLPAVELRGIFSVKYDFILSSLANPAAELRQRSLSTFKKNNRSLQVIIFRMQYYEKAVIPIFK